MDHSGQCCIPASWDRMTNNGETDQHERTLPEKTLPPPKPTSNDAPANSGSQWYLLDKQTANLNQLAQVGGHGHQDLSIDGDGPSWPSPNYFDWQSFDDSKDESAGRIDTSLLSMEEFPNFDFSFSPTLSPMNIASAQGAGQDVGTDPYPEISVINGPNGTDLMQAKPSMPALRSNALTSIPGTYADFAVPPSSNIPSGVGFLQISTDEQRWQATLSRSRAADRSFLYGVLSTKIFCRPSCASRRPARKHVIFFPFPNAAKAAINAGLRPCKRCTPEVAAVTDKGLNGVVRALRMIIADALDANADRQKPIKLEDLAKEADLSPFHFQRVFKSTTQMTPGDFSTACQTLTLQDILSRKGNDNEEGAVGANVSDILKTYSRWSGRTVKKALGGIAAADYAMGAPNTEMRCAVIDSPAGTLYVVYSHEGAVHAILVGEDSEDQLQTRFQLLEIKERSVAEFRQVFVKLEEKTKDRDAELPADLLPMLWRARAWLKLARENVMGGGSN